MENKNELNNYLDRFCDFGISELKRVISYIECCYKNNFKDGKLDIPDEVLSIHSFIELRIETLKDEKRKLGGCEDVRVM